MTTAIRIFSARIAICAGAALCASVQAPAQAVYRCEGDDGKVTYADAPCPTSARKTRRLDDRPPVIVHDVKNTTDTGTDARRDAAHDTGKTEGKTESKTDVRTENKIDSGPRVLGRLEPSRPNPRASVNPILEDEKLTAEREQQTRECEAQARRLRFLRDDVDGAPPGRRSSAELALRRAQDEFQQNCP